MKYRPFGKTGFNISEISLGTWQLGSRWGDPFDDNVAYQTLKSAHDLGINAFDTADVYQGSLSEKAIGTFINSVDQKPFVITKIGRKLPKQLSELYTKEALENYIHDSRKNLDQASLDMVLLHCPPTDVFYRDEVFQWMDEFKERKLIKHYGVSIEKVEEGLKALDYPGCEAIEVIFNMFRLKPLEELFDKAKEKGVGIIVRVPLASGLLTGKLSKASTFGPHDHRTFNREGQAFDKGETFSGVPYDIGLQAVERLKERFGKDLPLVALRFILMFDQVSTVIPGASKKEHIIHNVEASTLPPLSKEDMDYIDNIYDNYIKAHVHHLW